MMRFRCCLPEGFLRFNFFALIYLSILPFFNQFAQKLGYRYDELLKADSFLETMPSKLLSFTGLLLDGELLNT